MVTVLLVTVPVAASSVVTVPVVAVPVVTTGCEITNANAG